MTGNRVLIAIPPAHYSNDHTRRVEAAFHHVLPAASTIAATTDGHELLIQYGDTPGNVGICAFPIDPARAARDHPADTDRLDPDNDGRHNPDQPRVARFRPYHDTARAGHDGDSAAEQHPGRGPPTPHPLTTGTVC